MIAWPHVLVILAHQIITFGNGTHLMAQHRAVARFSKLALPLLLAFSLSACALGRSVVDITPPQSTATDTKAYAKIVAVTDDRLFEAAPEDAGTPSLGDAKEITDK